MVTDRPGSSAGLDLLQAFLLRPLTEEGHRSTELDVPGLDLPGLDLPGLDLSGIETRFGSRWRYRPQCSELLGHMRERHGVPPITNQVSLFSFIDGTFKPI